MFLAEVVAVHADEAYMNEKGSFDLAKAEPLVYSHGGYYALGEKLGTFGYSVRKKLCQRRRGSLRKRKGQMLQKLEDHAEINGDKQHKNENLQKHGEGVYEKRNLYDEFP